MTLGGYDPVSYHSGQAEPGKPDLTADHRGVRWYFASEEHRAMFQAEPEKYAPEFACFCAFAASKGFTAEVEQPWWNHQPRELAVA